MLKKSFLRERTKYGTVAAIRRLPMGVVKNIVDLGAHIGMFSVLAKFLHPGARVVAVEPFKGSFKLLYHNVSQFNIETIQVAIGISDTVGLVKGMNVSQHSYRSNIVGEGIEQVESLSLPELFRKLKINREGLFLKIDIEGAEHQFMEDEDAVDIMRSSVGIDFDLHQTDKVSDSEVYRSWLDRCFSSSHEIEFKGAWNKSPYLHGGVFAAMIRKDAPTIEHFPNMC